MKSGHLKIDCTIAEPEASSMIEAFRAIGYSIETAIADIIDNSISAGAKNIWIDYSWRGPDSVIGIMDDGCGMSDEELIQAMRLGSISPLSERRENDLGRFGMGMKTASFSQCRKFCVLSKKAGNEKTFWTWDLDFVNQENAWKIIRYIPEGIDFLERFDRLESGTVVLWWDIDRVTKDLSADTESSRADFLATMDRVKKHLSMVFHRYIERGVKIRLQGRDIEPWDPFMIGFNGLQVRPEAMLDGGRVRIKGFILPHRSKLSAEQYDYGKGPKGSWVAHQGFYVYRNDRLLVAGDWLGLFKKEVHYDLCRIRIDLKNDIDEDWQIDIKKSVARPPARLKEALLAIAKETRARAVEVYRHRGKIVKRRLGGDEYLPVWEERIRHGKRFYRINRQHPLVRKLVQDPGPLSTEIEKVFQVIEETVPIPLITLRENENENPHGKPFEGRCENVLDIMKKIYKKFISDGIGEKEAKARLANMEPFNFYVELIEKL